MTDKMTAPIFFVILLSLKYTDLPIKTFDLTDT